MIDCMGYAIAKNKNYYPDCFVHYNGMVHGGCRWRPASKCTILLFADYFVIKNVDRLFFYKNGYFSCYCKRRLCNFVSA
jgi:hypothetical protein